MKTILLKLAGPLQSWGTSSVFETRQTDLYPSKSAIIGMIAAAFGYKRDDDESIQKLNDLDFAVRVDYGGKLHKDYHIARSYKKNGTLDKTYVTERYYLEDAIFVVAISSEDEGWMDQILNALENPYFQVFLGRRSLPLTADFIIGTSNESAVEALEKLDWQGSKWMTRKNEKDIRVTIFADGDLLETDRYKLRSDRVVSFSQKNRQFSFRQEKRKDILLKNPFFEKPVAEHDAMSGLEEFDVSIES